MDSDRTPYPGLRAFRREESDLFFGREGHVDELVKRLGATHFLAVLGASGSGKSSLVRTGLFDALELGLLAEAGSDWQIADMHPGAAPIDNLAHALLASAQDPGEFGDAEVQTLASFLSRGPLQIAEWCSDGHLRDGANLLLLVDQFEELFRYDSYETREKAQALTSLLIESARQRRCPIYVVITMRSEYLGACSLIDGLAEAINRGQYLTPRMTRDQCQAAIEGPAGVCGFAIEPALVNRMLNDLASFAPWEEADLARAAAQNRDQTRDSTGSVNQLDRLARRADQLPLMQHVLNRLWTKAKTSSGSGKLTLRASDYDGLERSLAAHADEVLDGLVLRHGPGITRVAEKVFRALVTGNSIAEAVRRPTPFGELVALGGGDDTSVRAVVEAFRDSSCSFLVPGPEQRLFVATRIDISHESLIRQWPLLSRWVEAEANAAASWRRLDEAARRHASGKGGLLKGLDLSNILQAHAESPPNEAWSARYGNNFQPAIAFLEQSQKAEAAEVAEREQLQRKADREAEAAEQSRRRVRWLQRLVGATIGAAVISIVMLLGSLYILQTSKQEADERLATATREAAEQMRAADENARAARALAEQAKKDADRAQQQKAEAERQIVSLAARKIAQWQSEGHWDVSGGMFAAMGDRLPHDASGVPSFPAALAGELRRGAQLQALAERALGSVADAADPPVGNVASLDLGMPLSGIVATSMVERDGKTLRIALIGKSGDELRLLVFTATGDEMMRWQRQEPISIGPDTVGASPRNLSRVRGLAFADDGSHLAILFDDRIYVGTAEDLRGKHAAEYVTSVEGNGEAHSPAQTELAAPPSSQVRDLTLSTISSCSGTRPTFVAADGSGNVIRFAVAEPTSAGAPRPRIQSQHLPLPDSVKADRQLWSSAAPRISSNRSSDEFTLVVGGRHILAASCESGDKLERVPATSQDNIQAASFIGPNRIAAAAGGTILFLARNSERNWMSEPRTVKLPAGTQIAQVLGEDRAWVTTSRTIHEIWQLQPAGAEGSQAAVAVRAGGKPIDTYAVADLPLLLVVADDKAIVQRAMPTEDISPARVAMHSKLRAWLAPDAAEREYSDLLQLLTAPGLIGAGKQARQAAPTVSCNDPMRYLIELLERLPTDDPQDPAAAIQPALQEVARCPISRAAGHEKLQTDLVAALSNVKSMGDLRKQLQRSALLKRVLVAAGNGDPLGLRLLAFLADPQGEVPAQALRLGLRALATTAKGSPVPLPLVAVALRNSDPALAKRLLAADPLHDAGYFELKAHTEQEARAQLLYLIGAETLYRAVGDQENARRVGLKRGQKALLLADEDLDWVSQALERDPFPQTVPAIGPATAAASEEDLDPARLNEAFDRLGSLLLAEQSISPLAGATWLLLEDSIFEKGRRSLTRAIESIHQSLDRLPSVTAEEAAAAATAARNLGDYLKVANQKAESARAYLLALQLVDRVTVQQRGGGDWLNAAAVLVDGGRFLPGDDIANADLESLSWGFLQIINWNTFPSDVAERAKLKVLFEGCAKLQARLIAEIPRQASPTPRQKAALIGSVYTHYWLAVLADRQSKWPDRFEQLSQSLSALRLLGAGGDYPARHRLQFSRTLEWYAASIARSDDPAYERRLAAWDEARSSYLQLVKSLRRGDDEYIVASAVSRYSYTLTNMADDLTGRAQLDFEQGRRGAGIASGARAIGLRYEQQAAMKKDSYGQLLVGNNEARDFSYLDAHRGQTLGYTIGQLAGLLSIDSANRASVTRCEQLASSPYDPTRRSNGVGWSSLSGKAFDDAVSACRADVQASPSDRRLKFILGRLMSGEKAGKARDEMLTMLLQSGSAGYAPAYDILSSILPEKCSQIRTKMLDLYVNLLMRDYAAQVADLLEESGPRPINHAATAWLRSEAERLRKELAAPPADIIELTLAKVKSACSLE